MEQINIWPGWEIVRKLGSGAFGRVYEIQKKENGKIYQSALKIISVPQDETELDYAFSEGMSKQEVTKYFRSFVDEFTNEIVVMSSLKGYTNIVSYEDHMVIPHENGIGADILIRMELLTPLSKWFIQNEMSEADVIKLGCDICQALSLCHKNKIIHRDIKPENIFVNENGDFKLGDFGVARMMEQSISVMSKKGTDSYMAPEVYKGIHYDKTADIYSLGIVLYRFLNENRTPFLSLGSLVVGDREKAFARRMSGEKIPEPQNGNFALKMTVLQAIEFDASKRIESVEEFRVKLKRCSTEESKQVILSKIISQPQYESENNSTIRIKGEITPSKKSKKWILPVGILFTILMIGILFVGKKETDVLDGKGNEILEQETELLENETVETAYVNYSFKFPNWLVPEDNWKICLYNYDEECFYSSEETMNMISSIISTEPSVAEIVRTETGYYVLTKKIGTTVLTAECNGGKTIAHTLVVKDKKDAEISISPATVTFEKGKDEKYVLKPFVINSYTNLVKYEFDFECSDPFLFENELYLKWMDHPKQYLLEDGNVECRAKMGISYNGKYDEPFNETVRIYASASENYAFKDEFCFDVIIKYESLLDKAIVNEERKSHSTLFPEGVIKESTRIRAEKSDISKRLANAYAGEKLIIVENFDDGWSKVVYDGVIGYCKTDYIETD